MLKQALEKYRGGGTKAAFINFSTNPKDILDFAKIPSISSESYLTDATTAKLWYPHVKYKCDIL